MKSNEINHEHKVTQNLGQKEKDRSLLKFEVDHFCEASELFDSFLKLFCLLGHKRSLLVLVKFSSMSNKHILIFNLVYNCQRIVQVISTDVNLSRFVFG